MIVGNPDSYTWLFLFYLDKITYLGGPEKPHLMYQDTNYLPSCLSSFSLLSTNLFICKDKIVV